MNILITGANGFIGKALRIRLASGNKVIMVKVRRLRRLHGLGKKGQGRAG